MSELNKTGKVVQTDEKGVERVFIYDDKFSITSKKNKTDPKKVKEKSEAEKKAEEEKRIAKKKAAEEKRLAEKKAAEEKRLAKEREARLLANLK